RDDGLWFQGDAPRHAATGLFYKHLIGRMTLQPVAYARAYERRYPVISPSNYPPVFYLVEAAAYSVLGPSPHVAKGLVLLSALAVAVATAGPGDRADQCGRRLALGRRHCRQLTVWTLGCPPPPDGYDLRPVSLLREPRPRVLRSAAACAFGLRGPGRPRQQS